MAWTTPRTWAVGETLTAANFNTHIRDNLNAVKSYTRVRTTDSTAVNNSSVLVSDDTLTFPVLASEVWAVQLALRFTSNTTADFKLDWSVPAGTTYTTGLIYANPQAVALAWQSTTIVLQSSLGADDSAWLNTAVFVGGTAGNVAFQFSQNVANASNTVVKTGSFLVANRVA